MSMLLQVEGLSKQFTDRIGLFGKRTFYAVKEVSFTLNHQETLAIIGANGAGKSTLAKMLVGGLNPPKGEFYLITSHSILETTPFAQKKFG